MSDFKIIKEGKQRPEGPVVLSLRSTTPEEKAPETGTDDNSVLVVARIEADEIKQVAYQEGYEEGYREGERAAREIRAQAQAVLTQAEQIRAQTLDELEPEVVALAVDIAQRLVADQLALDENTINRIVRASLELVRDRERFLVYAHPQEARVLEAHIDDFQQLLSPGAVVKIVADEGIKAGGCRIETEQGVVDATLEGRWQALLDALHKGG